MELSLEGGERFGLKPPLSRQPEARNKTNVHRVDRSDDRYGDVMEEASTSTLPSMETNSAVPLTEKWKDEASASLGSNRRNDVAFGNSSFRLLQRTDQEWQRLGQQISAALEQQCSNSDIFQIPDYYLQDVFGATQMIPDTTSESPSGDATSTTEESGAEDSSPEVSSMEEEATGTPLSSTPSEDTLRTSNTKTIAWTNSMPINPATTDATRLIDPKPSVAVRRSSRGLFHSPTLLQSIAEASSNTVSTCGKIPSTGTQPSIELEVTDLTAVASRDDDVEHVIYLGSKP